MNNNSGQVLLVKDINIGQFGNPYDSLPYDITEFKGKIYFAAIDSEYGRELWVSDGTTEGTQLLADINPAESYRYGYSSFPNGFQELKGKLYFAANDGASGTELWASDGTTGGTRLVADINPIQNNGLGYGSFPNDLAEYKNKLYFAANDGASGTELWASDGTIDGTRLVADINSGNNNYDYPNSSNPGGFTEYQGKLYFAAETKETGKELWVTDGTTDGTRLVADINPNTNNTYGDGSAPNYFTEYEGKLYFAADDGETGRELWVTDGTENGTRLVADINPNDSSNIYESIEYEGKLYFAANDGETGKELWVSDGTENGTQLLADINPNGSSYPVDFTEYQGNLYFVADDGTHGRELWTSDGTTDGTQLLADITPGADGSYLSGGFAEIDEELFFGANNGETGTELFKLTAEDINTAILGTSGADNLQGTDAPERLEALGGKDTVNGGLGNDTILGGQDDDSLFGNRGDDLINGEDGDDYIQGNYGQDTLSGNSGNDFILGGIGSDLLQGGDDNDFLSGNSSDDTLIGGQGNDFLLGGGENDIFAVELDSGRSIISDFVNGKDKLGLRDNLTFNDLQIMQNEGETIEDIHGDVLTGLHGRNINSSDTLIKDREDNLVAVLLNVNATTITQEDFTTL